MGIAPAYAIWGRWRHAPATVRPTVAIGASSPAAMFPGDMSCIDWLLAMDPFQLPADVDHYVDGLRNAGFQ
jgi:hypothetical protein